MQMYCNISDMRLWLAVILVGNLMIEYVTAQAPIPDRPPGFIYKPSPENAAAPVILEAWVDLVCPDSKDAWLTYQKVADFYGPRKLRFSALLFPLPYHRAAMMAAQAAFVADELNPERTYPFFDNAFSKQPALSDDSIFNRTQTYVVETLAAWAGEVGYDRTEFASRLARSDATQWLARVQFKYGGTRGVFGTPQTYVNGALVYSDPKWTLDDWRNIIDPLLSRNRARRYSDGNQGYLG
ncbi:uncharacterized protein LOC121408721 isoform X2 [Lytechinus variegatus]|uniref:uncharacterized protein LOC121408721 isoform X2 n=1 Tax=Lytechinus variegatus TaxID=7654 RepID=UPI001BB1A549|nr:uncharacterized protein LOC121408721 isoform X2 [Lytechinus variegatus]